MENMRLNRPAAYLSVVLYHKYEWRRVRRSALRHRAAQAIGLVEPAVGDQCARVGQNAQRLCNLRGVTPPDAKRYARLAIEAVKDEHRRRAAQVELALHRTQRVAQKVGIRRLIISRPRAARDEYRRVASKAVFCRAAFFYASEEQCRRDA